MKHDMRTISLIDFIVAIFRFLSKKVGEALTQLAAAGCVALADDGGSDTSIPFYITLRLLHLFAKMLLTQVNAIG